MNVSFDPTWPWSLPQLGYPVFLGTAAVIVGLTILTYLGVRTISWKNLSIILGLRLLALAVAFLLLLRPSMGWEEADALDASKLLFLIDDSGSMTVTDEFNGLSRWRRACELIGSPAVREKLEELTKRSKIESTTFQVSDELREFTPSQEPKGSRTEIGSWLHEIGQRYAKTGRVRGVVLFTDGIDNGTRFNALDKAGTLKNLAPLHIFGLGKNEDSRNQKDIFVTRVQVAPSPVPIKTKMSVKATVQFPGFEAASVEASLWLQSSKDKEAKTVAKLKHTFKKGKEDVIPFEIDAPDDADEYKVLVKVAPIPGESSETNNEASTYVQVTKEGISVLIVDGKRRYETLFLPQQILAGDTRFRVSYLARTKEPGVTEADPYEFEKRSYDVIVLGDLSQKRFAGSDRTPIDHLVQMMSKKKTGLLLLGGFDALGNAGWGPEVSELLPVAFDKKGQIDRLQRLLPTAKGLAMPFFRLKPTEAETRELFETVFLALEGFTSVGTPKPGSVVLAESEGKEPMMVMDVLPSQSRVVVLGADTTWKGWRYSPETAAAHTRFWKQLLLWLAHQDESSGQLWLNLDTRRLVAGTGARLGLTFGLRDKKGDPARNADFKLKVIAPNGQPLILPTKFEQGDWRAHFVSPTQPGEYRVVLEGEGDDSDGGRLKETRSARFVVAEEDVEMQRIAADHDALARLAQANGGKFQLAEESALLQFLSELQGHAKEESVSRTRHWPDWRRLPASSTVRDQADALWSSATFPAFLVFAMLLCTEWGLRRWWDLV